jgi:hypothetical protein
MDENIKIEITPNKDGRLIATLYGKEFDVTELEKAGTRTFTAFKQTYEFEVAKSINKAKSTEKSSKSAKKSQKSAELEDMPVELEESENKDGN